MVPRFIPPCLPSPGRAPAFRPRLDSRDQARRLPHDGPPGRRRRPAAHPQRRRLVGSLSADLRGRWQVRSFLLDGEAVACDGDGLPVLDRLRYRRQDGRVFLYAFDLFELNGQDLRHEPIEIRKRQLATLLRAARVGLQLNEHISEPGDVVFRHACKIEGVRGITRSTTGHIWPQGTCPAELIDWRIVVDSQPLLGGHLFRVPRPTGVSGPIPPRPSTSMPCTAWRLH